MQQGNTFTHTQLNLELDSRLYLSTAIDLIISKCFYFDSQNFTRVKRGQAHEIIASFLGVEISNPLCKTISDRLEHKGAKRYTSHGTNFYKNIGIKEM